MAAEIGKLLYWLATILAAALAIWVLTDFLYGLSQGVPILRIAALTCAIVIWLIGCGFRSMLAGH